MYKEYRITEAQLHTLSGQAKRVEDAVRAGGDIKAEVAKALANLYAVLEAVHGSPVSS